MKVVVTNKSGDTGVFPFYMYEGWLAAFDTDTQEALDRFVDGKSCSTAETILFWMNEGGEVNAVDDDGDFSYVVLLDGKPCTTEEFFALSTNPA
jgi:hypothetical protein